MNGMCVGPLYFLFFMSRILCWWVFSDFFSPVPPIQMFIIMITLWMSCYWLRLIARLSLHLYITSLCPFYELSTAGRWVIIILGGIQRQMLTHSSCRSGSECWVHLHTNIQHCSSFFFICFISPSSRTVSCLTQISLVSLSLYFWIQCLISQ